VWRNARAIAFFAMAEYGKFGGARRARGAM
jgi:hypothetical protein